MHSAGLEPATLGSEELKRVWTGIAKRRLKPRKIRAF